MDYSGYNYRKECTSAAENGDFLLLKIPAMLFVDQNQVEVVSGRELLVDYDMIEKFELLLVQDLLSFFFFGSA